METVAPKHIPFPSIEHYKRLKKELSVLYNSRPNLPRNLNLRGTVKLHGTHADIVYDTERASIHLQSRNRILANAKDRDNCGFARHMVDDVSLEVIYDSLVKPALDIYSKTCSSRDERFDNVPSSSDDEEESDKQRRGPVKRLMISGEYCGGSIQKNVALTQLPPMFVIFAIKVDDHFEDPYAYRALQLPDKRIYNIFNIEPFRLSFTFGEDDSDLVDKLKAITDEVERECPFSKSLGVSGTGEGVVWCIEEFPHRTRFYFKVKGVEHTTSKVITLKSDTLEHKAALRNAQEFARLALTEARLQQGLDYLREQNLDISRQNTSAFLKWLTNDVLKEEADEIREASIDVPKLKKELASIALKFYRDRVHV